jgi:hypothetical protein
MESDRRERISDCDVEMFKTSANECGMACTMHLNWRFSAGGIKYSLYPWRFEISVPLTQFQKELR